VFWGILLPVVTLYPVSPPFKQNTNLLKGIAKASLHSRAKLTLIRLWWWGLKYVYSIWVIRHVVSGGFARLVTGITSCARCHRFLYPTLIIQTLENKPEASVKNFHLPPSFTHSILYFTQQQYALSCPLRILDTIPGECHTPFALVPALFISITGFTVICYWSQPGILVLGVNVSKNLSTLSRLSYTGEKSYYVSVSGLNSANRSTTASLTCGHAFPVSVITGESGSRLSSQVCFPDSLGRLKLVDVTF